jgi:hypothetical protein
VKGGQFDLLNQNYDELENDKEDTLLLIGENLLHIQKIMNDEKPKSTEKIEREELNIKSYI